MSKNIYKIAIVVFCCGLFLLQSTYVFAAPALAAKVSTKQQLIIDVLPQFITIFGNNPTDAEKAWWRKRISCDEIKTEKALVASMSFHKSKKVRKGSQYICGAKPNTLSSSSSSSSKVQRKNLAGIGTHVNGDTVRIGITKTDGSAITVTANNKFQIREGEGKVLATIGAGKEISVSYSDKKYHVRGDGKKFDTAGKIRFVPLHGAIMEIESYSDPSVTYKGKNYNRFRGVIEIRKCDNCSDIWAINELRTEEYLRGLGETSGEGPEEYVKALGIAARTYVLYHKVITGGRSIHNDFDITNTPNDQIYRGYEYEIITPRMSQIFSKSKGIIVADKESDKPVATIYFSDSDGRTRSAKEGLGTSRFPHLQKSVQDPYHVSSKCLGHCVGLSAQGAYGFAKARDWTFQQILHYYYQGVTLVKAY
ncbi:MAG: SpoIID/LytB domain-containing protein [Patescibacteria group bacterium]